ncbi:major outer membrane protein, partial [Shewanella algicola]
MKLLKLSLLSTLVSLCLVSTYSAAQDAEDGIDVSGTLRANYSYKEYSENSKDKSGDLTFEMASVKFNGKLGDWQGLIILDHFSHVIFKNKEIK